MCDEVSVVFGGARLVIKKRERIIEMGFKLWAIAYVSALEREAEHLFSHSTLYCFSMGQNKDNVRRNKRL